MAGRTPVLVVEDHQLLAQALELALRMRGVAAQRVRGVERSEVLCAAAALQPGLVLLDLDLGGDASGIDLISPLCAGTEQAVLGALVEGRAAEAIAADRYVSIATVRSQIRGILRQLGVNSQLEAVATARRAGWPSPERATR